MLLSLNFAVSTLNVSTVLPLESSVNESRPVECMNLQRQQESMVFLPVLDQNFQSKEAASSILSSASPLMSSCEEPEIEFGPVEISDSSTLCSFYSVEDVNSERYQVPSTSRVPIECSVSSVQDTIADPDIVARNADYAAAERGDLP